MQKSLRTPAASLEEGTRYRSTLRQRALPEHALLEPLHPLDEIGEHVCLAGQTYVLPECVVNERLISPGCFSCLMLEIRYNIPVQVDGNPHLGNSGKIQKLCTRGNDRRCPLNHMLVKIRILHVTSFSPSSSEDLLLLGYVLACSLQTRLNFLWYALYTYKICTCQGSLSKKSGYLFVCFSAEAFYNPAEIHQNPATITTPISQIGQSFVSTVPACT